MENIVNLYKSTKIRILGLMSGTSLDGLDLADISFQSKSFFFSMEFHNYAFFPFTKNMRTKILTTIREKKAQQISELNYELGQFFADCILKYINKQSLAQKIGLIASHGQTIYHKGSKCTLQIGEADIITQRTKIPVVFDFRAADIASGGEGAPLVPYFDQYLQTQKKETILFLNLGGIANFSITTNQGLVFSDTGPANILLNLLVTWKTKGEFFYDKDANFARQGKIDLSLLQELLAHPFFSVKPPKSTGYEDFGEEFLKTILHKYSKLDWKDILITLTFLSATTIANICKKYLIKNSVVAVSGGGLHNPLLMEYLQIEFAPFELKDFTEVFNLDADAKEAAAFAFFAYEKFQKTNKFSLTKKKFGKLALP